MRYLWSILAIVCCGLIFKPFIERELSIFLADRATPLPTVEIEGRPIKNEETPVEEEKDPSRETDEGRRVSEITHEYREALAVVKGEQSSGSSFVAKLGLRTCLFTNQHVVAGMKNPQFIRNDQTRIEVGTAAAAVDHDLMAYGLSGNPAAFEIMTGVDRVAKIGDRVAVLGNPDGGGVIHPLTGSIVGIGPNLVEISASIVPGNSGSPVVHLPTGKVIAIASYIMKERPVFRLGSSSDKVRRFCYRIDSVKAWEPVRWNTFTEDWKTMEEVHKRTSEFALLFDLGLAFLYTSALGPDDGMLRILVQRGCTDFAKARTPADYAAARATLLTNLRWAATVDLQEARRRITYDYFRKQLDEEVVTRAPLQHVLEPVVFRLMGDGIRMRSR